MFFATASHNSLFLPVISKNHAELSSEFVSLNGEKVVLDKNITVLGFPGSNIEEVKANLFNLNQKIYKTKKDYVYTTNSCIWSNFNLLLPVIL